MQLMMNKPPALVVPDHTDGSVAVKESLPGRQPHLKGVLGLEPDGVSVGDTGVSVNKREWVFALLDRHPVSVGGFQPVGPNADAPRVPVQPVPEQPWYDNMLAPG